LKDRHVADSANPRQAGRVIAANRGGLPQSRRAVLPERIGSQAQPSKQLPVDFFTIAPLVM
jgi:hypothetical protein